eukprot:TRINITY_DN1480_c0_g3_i1.p1 TRINITY_DN1480_c0_g3~~TRINITY_DN1480_c0_g3_i1.p1  ORF type:complete len:163 (-),score=45.39 TRINITY_DN1480_c0_g3_i1:424-876(-)
MFKGMSFVRLNFNPWRPFGQKNAMSMAQHLKSSKAAARYPNAVVEINPELPVNTPAHLEIRWTHGKWSILPLEGISHPDLILQLRLLGRVKTTEIAMKEFNDYEMAEELEAEEEEAKIKAAKAAPAKDAGKKPAGGGGGAKGGGGKGAKK